MMSFALFPSVIDGKADRPLLPPPNSKADSNQIQQRKRFNLSEFRVGERDRRPTYANEDRVSTRLGREGGTHGPVHAHFHAPHF